MRTDHVSDAPGVRTCPPCTPVMSKLCTSAPSFLITNCVQPAGIVVLSSTNRYSSMLTFTVVVGFVHACPPIPELVPTVVVCVVGGGGGLTPTPNDPFIPFAA